MIPPIRRWSAPIECATLPPAALPPRYRAPGPGGPTSTPQTRTRPPTPESYAPATFSTSPMRSRTAAGAAGGLDRPRAAPRSGGSGPEVVPAPRTAPGPPRDLPGEKGLVVRPTVTSGCVRHRYRRAVPPFLPPRATGRRRGGAVRGAGGGAVLCSSRCAFCSRDVRLKVPTRVRSARLGARGSG